MARRGRRSQLTVVCWLYPGPRNYRPRYVNILFERVRQFLPLKHRFVCIYDDTAYAEDEFDPEIELFPIPESARPLLALKSLGGPVHPACFARLWHFSQEAADAFPGRVFMFDLDSIPIDDMSHLVEYRSDADFVGLLRRPGSPEGRWYTCGACWILRAGSLTEVWDEFIADPEGVRAAAAEWFLNGREQRVVGWVGGSDQSVMSYRLVDRIAEGRRLTYWPDDCGILLWDHFRRQRGEVEGCLLQFNGVKKPWQLDWPLTRRAFSATEYRVVNRPLRYGKRRYNVGEPLMVSRPSHARVLIASRRIEAV